MATKKAGWASAWVAVWTGDPDKDGAINSGYWLGRTRADVVRDVNKESGNPSCWRPVPVEIREAKPKRKAGKSKRVPFENTSMPSFSALREYGGKPRAKAGQRKGKRGGGR